ncbi:hypothetical protein C8F01DRAFT_370890 [Mycena amicta]|nr:hypothetical protein C8F01DRAFT_370890 [Mycena amicta]
MLLACVFPRIRIFAHVRRMTDGKKVDFSSPPLMSWVIAIREWIPAVTVSIFCPPALFFLAVVSRCEARRWLEMDSCALPCFGLCGTTESGVVVSIRAATEAFFLPKLDQRRTITATNQEKQEREGKSAGSIHVARPWLSVFLRVGTERRYTILAYDSPTPQWRTRPSTEVRIDPIYSRWPSSVGCNQICIDIALRGRRLLLASITVTRKDCQLS